jgi:hypothetical protein
MRRRSAPSSRLTPFGKPATFRSTHPCFLPAARTSVGNEDNPTRQEVLAHKARSISHESAHSA